MLIGSIVYERTIQKCPFDDANVGHFFPYERFVFFLYFLEDILEIQSTLITF